jgi:hypothetical protein
LVESTEYDPITAAADLRDAAINASAAAWRITGVEASVVIRSADSYGKPVSSEDLAYATTDTFGWATMRQAARRIADAWTHAAAAWQAADAHLTAVKPIALAKLSQGRGTENGSPRVPTEQPKRALLQRPDAFQVLQRRTSRTIRRPNAPRDDTSTE